MSNVSNALILRLRTRAAWHASEAARYQTAAEVLETEQASGASDEPAGAGPTSDRRYAGTNALDLVVQVMESDDRAAWAVAELLEAMQHRGWQTNSLEPINTVRTAISRLVKRGVLERVGVGSYRLAHRVARAHEQHVAQSDPQLPTLNGSGSFVPEGAHTEET